MSDKIKKIIGKTISEVFPDDDDGTEFTLTFTDGSVIHFRPYIAWPDDENILTIEAEYVEKE